MPFARPLALFLLATILLTQALTMSAAERPNIVFLFTDDQRWDCMGCMGNNSILTPHLDRLAEDGTLFTNAFHAVPICEPSRATIMIGTHLGTHRSGFDRPTDFTISRAEFANSYPVLLRAAGYRTAFVGKWGFAVTDTKIPNVTYDGEERLTKSQLWTHEENMPSDAFDVWNGFAGQGSYQVEVGNTTIHGTEHRGNEAIAFIEDCAKNHPDQPFVVQVSFKAPHGPMQPDKRHLALYDDIDIPIDPASTQEDFDNLPATVRNNYRGAKGGHYKGGNALKPYYALITGVDEVLGRIRKTLEDLELADNTVILYTSDNGYFNGYKRLEGKDLLYEASLRSPLIVLDPRVPRAKPARRVKGLVSSVDIAPTLLALGGLEPPESMQGLSFQPMIDGKTKSIRDDIFAENHFSNFQLPAQLAATPEEKARILKQGTVRSKCVRTAKWKYIRYFETDPVVEELFAIDKDSTELENLAANPEYAETLETMRKRCTELILQTTAQ